MIDLIKLGRRPATPTPWVAFRYREVGGDVLLTSYFGDWLFVSKEEFSAIVRNEVGQGSALYDRLAARNFVRDRIDVEAEAARARRKKTFLDAGPNLHAMVVTLRWKESWVYSHAARADLTATHTDMTPETAEKAVELALQTTSPSVTIEFQGGEPLVNFPVMKHIIEHALVKNRAYGKRLEFTLVSNLAMMDEDKLSYLMDHKVQICTSIDGPEAIHNKQRILAGGNAWRESVKWIRRINQEYENRGLDPMLYHVEALVTTTRALLDHPKALVDTYVDLGCRAIFLRPLDPFGWAEKTSRTTEYPRHLYMDFYRQATDYILQLNRQGVQVLERYGAIFLTKILGDDDSNFLDIRSPGGAGIGQLAYSYDGKIYSSDEGRMLAHAGDDFFCIGDVQTSTYRQLMTHETVRALTLASNLDAQPDCVNCTYNPYCGIVPEHSYRTQGSIWGRMRESVLCAVHKGIQDYLFDLLRRDDPETIAILKRWTTVRERSHFVQQSSASLAEGWGLGAARGVAAPSPSPLLSLVVGFFTREGAACPLASPRQGGPGGGCPRGPPAPPIPPRRGVYESYNTERR